ncbi:MAG: radical SAM protein [Bdellovibrionaceae bacterium]|nr:radical SAM protein [Pseudobdellovibrionaceae bacterium]
MELRRHKDILAIRAHGTEAPLAFHARNLQVAEISDEAWKALVPTAVSDFSTKEGVLTSEAAQDLEAWNNANSAEVTEDSNQFGVRSLTLNVTQICNLHCTYCAAGGDGTYGDPVTRISIEKTLPQLKFFMDQIPAGERFHIAFLGGEPLLYPLAIQAIAEYVFAVTEVKGIVPSFKITTNGTLIDERAINILRAMNAHVTVSLDGPREVNDRQRRTRSNEGSFETAFQGLIDLLAHRSDLASVGVHAVFNENNLEVEKAWELFSSIPVDYMEFTYSVNHHDAASTLAFNLSMEKALSRAWEKGGESELLRILNVREIFDRLDEQKRRLNHCGMGKSFMVVDSRNRLWTCPWTVGQKGNRLGENSELDYEQLEKYQKSQIEMNGCESCWARFLCGGGCSFVHGSTGGMTAQKKIDFCERTRFLMAQVLAYYGRSRAATAGAQQ